MAVCYIHTKRGWMLHFSPRATGNFQTYHSEQYWMIPGTFDPNE